MNAVDLYFKRGKSVLCVGKTSRTIPRRIADVLLSSGSATAVFRVLAFASLERKYLSREPLRNKIEFLPHSKPIFFQYMI